MSQLRLFEICPFTEFSHTVSIIFSYYFLVTAGYLFPTFEEVEIEHYQEAMLDGLQFSNIQDSQPTPKSMFKVL